MGAGLLTCVPASALSGGTQISDSAYAFVGRLEVGTPGVDGHGCSAALIDSSWIVTATSCFGGAGLQAGAPPKPTTVTLGRTATNAGYTAQVTYVAPKPDRDVTLGLLNAPVTGITPATVSTTAPAAAETLLAVGYGRTTDTWAPDQARIAPFIVTTTTDTTTALTGADGVDTCQGDAGGPALRQHAGAVELVALHSTTWQHGCLLSHETRQGSTEARVDNITDWIRQQTATISIRNANGLCLDLGSNAPGTKVVTVTCQAGNLSQQWRVLSDGTIRNYNGLAMDIGSNNPGELVVTAVVQAGNPSQQWQVLADGTIRNHNALCADIGANATGTPVGTATCSVGNSSQQWTVGELHAVSGKIRNHNGLCADLTSNTTGTWMITAACQPAGSASQQWTAPIDGTIRNANGLCLDLGSNAPGTPIGTAACQAGGWISQQWRVLSNGTIRNYNGLVMDIGTNAAGATVIIANTQPGNPSQQWTMGG
ncbi:ricin-type beta-trefoil lectin domain protein [Amycolatopsis sp. NPDC051371]|uniref:ricin-type beta-trefoil lectin domain protein n=1 Tax=Amycolatopsis sp. NPDC051371 TaxID=3155800 RepID=UPI00342A0312